MGVRDGLHRIKVAVTPSNLSKSRCIKETEPLSEGKGKNDQKKILSLIIWAQGVKPQIAGGHWSD
jgi:hypothetical protein